MDIISISSSGVGGGNCNNDVVGADDMYEDEQSDNARHDFRRHTMLSAAASTVLLADDDLPPISPMNGGGGSGSAAAARFVKGDQQHASGGCHYPPRFRLDYDFKCWLKSLPEPWVGRAGNGMDDVIAQIVFERTYQRNGEPYAGMVIRVVEGVYNMQRQHFERNKLPWKVHRAQASAKEMARLMFEMKFLPPGRGLWAMGTSVVEDRKLHAALQNCAFVSTRYMDNGSNFSDPFEFCMDLSMLGVGVGFDTEGARRKLRLYLPLGTPDDLSSCRIHIVQDSREGWVNSLRVLMQSYAKPRQHHVQFDYSEIRAKGTPLKAFGGISSGPKPLMQMHELVRQRLSSAATAGSAAYVDSRLIVDIMNMIAACVVSGNIRRSAEIAFGRPDDADFFELKNYDKNPERSTYGWTSNNSVLATVGTEYGPFIAGMVRNGEPGIAWLDNMRTRGRMCDPPTDEDSDVDGTNPCGEISLAHKEMCTLVETFIANHDTLDEFKHTLKYAFIYAKSVTLGASHHAETNKVMMRKRRIGTSITGVTQYLAKNSLATMKTWLDGGYRYLKEFDARLSDLFCVQRSVKITTVKPSGTVSLLAGATPGMHYPISQNYIRRIILDNKHPMVERLRAKGYHIEPRYIFDATAAAAGEYKHDENSCVVSIPVSLGKNVTKTEQNVTMWEQLELAAFLQTYWADNQVSCTVKFDPVTEGPHLQRALELYQFRLKSVSFLPKGDLLDYPQLPYEPITYERYLEIIDSQMGRSSCCCSKKTADGDEKEEVGGDVVMSSSQPPQQQQQPLSTTAAATADDDKKAIIETGQVPDDLSFCEGEQCEIAEFKAAWRKQQQH